MPDIDSAVKGKSTDQSIAECHAPKKPNNDLIAKRLISCSEETGDPLWRLPLWKNYQVQ